MISYCNRRLYKGNSYEICLPITDTGVTSVRFYTSGDIVVEKEGKIVDDTMCFELTKLELDLLPDGVLRYSYADFDSNTRYVIVTPADYSGSTLEDIIADAFESGHTAAYDDGLSACTGGNADLIANIQGDYFFIPEGTTKIRQSAFQNLLLSAMTIPDSVTYIGNWAFYGNFFSAMTIPGNVRTIDREAFYYNSKLETLVLEEGVQYIGESSFSQCTGLTSVTLPNTLLSIKSRAFQDDINLLEVNIPDSVTTLGEYAFYNCENMTGVTIGSGITQIEDHTFGSCENLTGVTIPATVTGIGRYVFSDSSGMTSMTFEGVNPPVLSGASDSLGSPFDTFPIYVPCSAVETYKTTWSWSKYKHRITCRQEPESEATTNT